MEPREPDWLIGPMTAKVSGKPNDNYEDALLLGIYTYMHGSAREGLTAWYPPEVNGELSLYFEFSPYAKPNRGVLRATKAGLSYTRRLDPETELRGLTQDNIARRAAEHVRDALIAVTERKDLDTSLLPPVELLWEQAKRGQDEGRTLPHRQRNS